MGKGKIWENLDLFNSCENNLVYNLRICSYGSILTNFKLVTTYLKCVWAINLNFYVIKSLSYEIDVWNVNKKML